MHSFNELLLGTLSITIADNEMWGYTRLPKPGDWRHGSSVRWAGPTAPVRPQVTDMVKYHRKD